MPLLSFCLEIVIYIYIFFLNIDAWSAYYFSETVPLVDGPYAKEFIDCSCCVCDLHHLVYCSLGSDACKFIVKFKKMQFKITGYVKVNCHERNIQPCWWQFLKYRKLPGDHLLKEVNKVKVD